MIKKGIPVKNAEVLVLGFTFKENCPDVINTKVVDVVTALKEYETNVTIFDPLAKPDAVRHVYSLEIQNELPENKYSAIILAVAHDEFKKIRIDSLRGNDASVVYDVKRFLDHSTIDEAM